MFSSVPVDCQTPELLRVATLTKISLPSESFVRPGIFTLIAFNKVLSVAIPWNVIFPETLGSVSFTLEIIAVSRVLFFLLASNAS